MIPETFYNRTLFGFRPLTLCFCSSLLELPAASLSFFLCKDFFWSCAIYLVIEELWNAASRPRIKPAVSWTYSLKLLLSISALSKVLFDVQIGLVFCALLMWISKPQSYSNLVALSICSVSWFFGTLLLRIGNHRRLPQHWYGLRGFWVTQFMVQFILFLEYSALHSGEDIHIVRGFYMLCCVLLFFCTFIPVDQELYEEVVLDNNDNLEPRLQQSVISCINPDTGSRSSSVKRRHSIYRSLRSLLGSSKEEEELIDEVCNSESTPLISN